jgi:hypothetical protein
MTSSHANETQRASIELLKEGQFVAEVDVTLIESDHPWAPYLSAADMLKLDAVRLALREGDLKSAAQLARIYELKPFAAE